MCNGIETDFMFIFEIRAITW